MRNFLKKLTKALAYVAAGLVILLALAVGLFRLLLPRLPEYQEEIKDWANAAIGMQVEFEDMDARWRLSGPELTFQQARLTTYDADNSLLTAGEVSVGVSLLRLLKDRQVVVDRIQISNSRLTVQLDYANGWLLQGIPLQEVLGSRELAANQEGNVAVVANDIAVDYLLPESEEALSFALEQLEIVRTDVEVTVNALVELPESMGGHIDIAGSQRVSEAQAGIWHMFVEGKQLLAPGWSALDPMRLPQLGSGSLDLSASLQVSPGAIDHATVEFVLSDVASAAAIDLAPVDAQGRVEYSKDDSGWLLAASNFVLRTVDDVWPRTSLSIQIAETATGEIKGLAASASFLNVEDLRYVAEWLPVEYRDRLEQFDPSGVLRDVRVSVDDLQSDQPRFDIATQLIDAGMAATETLPGLRRLSGLIRTDNAGGRLELESSGLVLDLAAHLDEKISFDDAVGTIIWRRNAQGTIVLSDSIQIRNADLDSQSSLQVSIPSDGAAPEVDFRSSWSVNDVSAVKRYLPAKLIKPRLYDWLSAALVAGNVSRGTTHLAGPLDKFPFDNGEGVFLVESRLENTTLRYSDKWPDAENVTLDVVLDGMRLYSLRNSAINAGNSVQDAHVEIADLRQPVLTIDAFATGSLASIHEFSQNSPIANLFGSHLERVGVAGDASFSLQLNYPILDRDNYSFSTRLQTSDGTLSFEGFQPQLSGLNGVVNISRDQVSSEGLFGVFLGEQVNIELLTAGDEYPLLSVIAETSGRLTDTGVVAELAPQLENILHGASDYKASIRFPKPKSETPVPLQIQVESELLGMEIDLPIPLKKSSDTKTPMSFTIEFPESGRIDAIGSLSDELKWSVSFLNLPEGGWDFDRGALAIGGDYLQEPEIRGLHISGETADIRFHDWLDLARASGGPGKVNIGERIRSIDLVVGKLNVIGQDLKDHRVAVQRSAQDWLVTVGGEQVSGSITVPYNFESGRPLVVDLERLVLPGLDEEGPAPNIARPGTDPRSVPPLTIKAQSFSLGERSFGELTAEFISTDRGLESSVFATQDPSFTLKGVAGWIVDATAATGQRTYLNATLTSTDVEATMSRLNYQPGIKGNELEIDLDVGWPGAPGEDFLDRVSGNVALRMGSGQLQDVKPGAGRVFGLMSVVALPRRLSLDFRDVFEKGLGFDKIAGTFRIEDGQAYTCDLSLEGPAADVGIVGRAGLATRDYDQAAIVSANVGNTLPLVGTVLAGPQVGAALLIFSQIFKKPLRAAGQVYYGIDGSWDAPDIASADYARFEASSNAALCLEGGGE